MNKDKTEYLDALMKLYDLSEDKDSCKILRELIDDYFYMIEHMKQTSLYDVYEYEKRIGQVLIEPMEILALDKERLKKEVNELREQLSLNKKYKD